MSEKRRRVSDLLDAGITYKEIVNIVGCSVAAVYNVKKLKEGNGDLTRKPGSGGQNKILTEDFMEAVISHYQHRGQPREEHAKDG